VYVHLSCLCGKQASGDEQAKNWQEFVS
jgi:hypothetical protein